MDAHVQIDSNDHSTMLYIPEASRDDTGKYTLHLDNSSGVISASCNVKVLDSPGPCQNLLVITGQFVSVLRVEIIIFALPFLG